jgi:hypothetical protein
MGVKPSRHATWYSKTLKKYIVTDSLSDTPTTLHCLNWYLISPFPSYSAAWREAQRHEYIIALHSCKNYLELRQEHTQVYRDD